MKEASTAEFHKKASRKDGLTSDCKMCRSQKGREYYSENRERILERNKQWYEAHPQHVSAKSKRYRAKYPDKARMAEKRRYAKHPENKIAAAKRWMLSHPETAKTIKRRHDAKRRSAPKGKLSMCMSSGINDSLNRGSKGKRHWEILVAYTADQLKRHLEKQFKPGMTWENHGTYWHIDHKIPIAAFNFETPEDLDFKKCWALKNLQPLEAIKNKSKRDKIEKPFQPALLM